jgi:two-component system, LytTR family, sensor kinase
VKVLAKHIGAWVLFATISLFVRIAELNWSFNLVYIYETYTKYLIAAIIFYISYYLIFIRYFARGKVFETIALLLLLLFANGIFRHIVFSWLFVELRIFPMYGYDFWQSFTIGIWWWYMFGLLGFGFYQLKKSIETERKLRITETEKLNLQNQELKLQYNYLQAQINPHFLYNTLNFLYTEAQDSNEKLADAIIALSRIMRYSIAEGKEKDTIAVEQEVEVLDKYILLHQLRFDNQLNIQFTKEMENPGRQIPPYILITLVENAFKHGLFSKAEEMLYIHLHCTDSSLVFYTENTINPLPKNQSGSGVGLTNIAERLRLTYGNRQRLQYYKEGNRFIVRLEIDFASQKITATAV